MGRIGVRLCALRLKNPTEEMVHAACDFFAAVGQGAMTAVRQLYLSVWHHLAIPPLIVGREQNVVLSAYHQRRRFLCAQVILSTLERRTVGADIVEQIER